jgi:hypothetical protein
MADALMDALGSLAGVLRWFSDEEVTRALLDEVGLPFPAQGVAIDPALRQRLVTLAESPSSEVLEFVSAAQDVIHFFESLRDIITTAASGSALGSGGLDIALDTFLHLLPNVALMNALRWNHPFVYELLRTFAFVDDQVGLLSNETLSGGRWRAMFDWLWDARRDDGTPKPPYRSVDANRDKLMVTINLLAVAIDMILLAPHTGGLVRLTALGGFDPSPASTTPNTDAELARASTFELVAVYDPNATHASVASTQRLRVSFAIPSDAAPSAPGGQIAAPLAMVLDGALDVTVPVPSGTLKLSATSPDSSGSDAVVLAEYVRDPTATPISFLGFFLHPLKINAQLRGSDFTVRIAAAECGFWLKPRDDEGLSKKAVDKPKKLSFSLDLTLGAQGATFQGGTRGFDHALGLNLGIGRVESLHLGLGPPPAGISSGAGLELTTVITLKLGPFSCTVDGLGIAMVIQATPDNTYGNLGPLNIPALAVRAPTGLAMRLDSGPVQGAGYGSYDPAAGRYAGALQLKLGGRYQLAAVVVAITRFPDGHSGLSLLVQGSLGISPGWPLVLGLRLTRISALFGYNRGFNVDALRAGIATGLVDVLLSPADPLKNIAAATAQLDALFPVKEGAYTFALSARLAWNDRMHIDLGALYDTSAPSRIVALAKLEMDLRPAGKINLAAVGVIDWGAGSVEVKAALYDSKIAGLEASGSAALLVRWKGDRTFVLSIGGFHPSFQSPVIQEPLFKDLQRFALKWPSTPLLKLHLSGYFAVTPCSLQIGGDLDVTLGMAGVLTLSGELGFDALFEWDPTYFEGEARGRVEIQVAGETLAGVRFKGQVAGPHPMHCHGEVTVEILWWDHTFTVDKGLPGTPPPEPAAVDIGAKARTALATPALWQAAELSEEAMRVHVADASSAVAGQLTLHPLQALRFHQNDLPFGLAVDKVGRAPVAQRTTLSFGQVTVGGAPVQYTPVSDDFARARFQAVSNEQRLGGQGFEPMTAGLVVDSSTAVRVSAGAVAVTTDPEIEVLGGGPAPPSPSTGPIPPAPGARALALLGGNRRFLASVSS